MIIDAHHHLWQIGRNDQSWPVPGLSEIYRDFAPKDWLSAAHGLGISGTVLVQSQPSEVDTLWLLQVAAAWPPIKAVIGWSDLASPRALQNIAYLARQPKLAGLRPMLQSLPEDDRILRDDVRPALDAMVAHGLTLDALVFTRHLPHIDTLAKRHPDLSIIIDHGAKPPIADGHDAEWRDRIADVAENRNVACKLSGLLTESAAGQSADALTPYADHLLAAFGPERLMWGSDWPVVLLKDSYRHWFDWTMRWLADKPGKLRDAILGGTAHTIYKLN